MPSELKKHASSVLTVLIPKLEPVVSSFLVNHPGWQMAFHQAIGLYGYYMALKQEDVNEFVEYIKNNPEKYRDELVNSKEFADGFVQVFRSYLEIRVKEKKYILKRILEGFTYCEEKSRFPLERLDDALLKITPQTLEMLIFIKKTIVPLRDAKVLEEVSKRGDDPYHDKDYWIRRERKRHFISTYINSWIHLEYNPNSEKVKDRYNVKDEWDKELSTRVFDIENEKRDKLFTAIDELVGLGVMKIKVSSGGGGMSLAGGASFDFSELGYQFIDYIDT